MTKKVFEFVCIDRWDHRDYNKSHLFFGTQEAAEARLVRLTADSKQRAEEDHANDIKWDVDYILKLERLLAFFGTLPREDQRLFEVMDVTVEKLEERIGWARESYAEAFAAEIIPSDTWSFHEIEQELETDE